MVVAKAFHEIARKKFHVVKLREIENMRLCQYGRRNIQLLTNFYHIIEEMRVGKPFAVFVYELFTDSAIRH